MKSNFALKTFVILCLSLAVIFVFSACADETVYRDVTLDSGLSSNVSSEEENIYVPQDSSATPGETPDFSEKDDTTSSTIPDTDGDGKVNIKDDDIDNDGIKNEVDGDVDGDNIVNDKDDDIDGDGVTNDGDKTPEGPSSSDTSSTNEGPFVPFN